MSLFIEEEGEVRLPFDVRAAAELVTEAALELEGCPYEVEISLLLTTDEEIRRMNRIHRQIDRATDVLSFPMFAFTPGAFPEDVSELMDPGSALLPLGDMALSVEKIRAQAQEFGHSQEREIGYLTVHSVLHLLGYDHLDEGPMKKQMRGREEAIMEHLNIPR